MDGAFTFIANHCLILTSAALLNGLECFYSYQEPNTMWGERNPAEEINR